MNILKKVLLTITVLTGLLMTIGAPAVYAGPFDASKGEACQGATLGAGNCDKKGAADKIGATLNFVLNLLSIIVGIIAVIMIIINGLRFITAGGDSNSVSAAKNGIIYALIGLIVVAMAQIIVRFIVSKI